MSELNAIKIEGMDNFVDEVWAKINLKMEKMATQMKGKSPHKSVSSGIYDDMRLDWWTSGFWPGMLWVMYSMTGVEAYKKEAWDWDQRIEECFTRKNNFHHDVGFQFLLTAVIKYKLTGDVDGKRRGLQAATFLAGRFNTVGNFIRAWNQDERTGWSIIDTSMNLSLLFWAAKELKDPRYKHIAITHADTVLKHFIREDGSVKHIVSFDPENGQYIECFRGQGYAPDSAWSRGQAWALYGMVNTYKYTGDKRYLYAAQRVANFFITALGEDAVPYWDSKLPDTKGQLRDTSAAACAASGMLELVRCLPCEEARIYASWASKILRSLTNNYTTLDQLEYEGILREGTASQPDKDGANVSLIYGDYFYIECFSKLKGWSENIF